MALITITGFPLSGKSTRVDQIREYIGKKLGDPEYAGSIQKVVVVSDDSLSIPRSVYDSSKTEKVARASLFTALQRAMNKNTIVIADSPNYIKGYRYQMYCAARELSIRVATVFVVATPDVCRERFEALINKFEAPSEGNTEGEPSGHATYSQNTFENLIQRYEEPNSMARWDSPLFTIPWTDTLDELPLDQIWKAVTEGDVKPPNAGTVGAPRPESSALQILDTTTTSIVKSILSEQSASGVPGGLMTLSIAVEEQAPISLKLELPSRNVTLPELQRHKRQFVNVHKKAVTLGATEKGEVAFDEKSVAEKFGMYLEENVK